MRRRRIKAPKGMEGLYHCTSRVVGGEFLLGDREKEEFVRMMWQVADFHEIYVLDYAVMSNHYHQLVKTPKAVKLTNKKLLQKLCAYYGPRSREVQEYESAIITGGEMLERIRKRYFNRMGDVSQFEKILKQRFSCWYNRRNNRRGTLWMERFDSVLAENTLEARKMIAAYIDLNPLRAGMVEDPARYRFCGYGAAMGGDLVCRRGIEQIMGLNNWKEAAAKYRLFMMKRGHQEVVGKWGKVSRKQLLEVLREKGNLPSYELLRLRVRYFTDGLALGSEKFVEEIFGHYRSHFGEKRKSGARSIQCLRDSQLTVLGNLRVQPVS